ncbi:hypothetical protein DFH28DRAFT_1228982 [Melampsora americana]|nr:hypothetical protein DFH28DRAFT_1228982 [Melampsora americana]
MDSASGSLNSCSSRPKKQLPSNSVQPSIEQESTTALTASDLGGTLVPQTAEELAELSTESDDDDGEINGSGSKRRKGRSKSTQPRRQIKIEYIQDKSRRNITFGKRKNGIFKKANEISILTGCEVMLIVAPKDSDHKAYTFATPKLQPMVTESAGETYIQNCLRYGALMPGAPSGMPGAYGSAPQNMQRSLISTLDTGPRGSPTTHNVAPSHTSMYPYGTNSSIIRRPQASYGLPHPLSSSPQSNSSMSVNPSSTNQTLSVSDKSTRASSDSPMQRLGNHNANASPRVQWQTGGHSRPSEYHTVGSGMGPNGGSVGPSSDVLTEWNPSNPRGIFQPSPSLTSASIQSRGNTSFALNNGSVAGIPYSNISAGAPFHRQSPDNSIIGHGQWQGLPPSGGALRPATAVSNAGHPSAANCNGANFLEPLVLSQPYENRSTSSDGPMSAGPTNAPSNRSTNMQSSLSQYGDNDSYENIRPSGTYVNDEGSDIEGRGYNLDTPDQGWQSTMH